MRGFTCSKDASCHTKISDGEQSSRLLKNKSSSPDEISWLFVAFLLLLWTVGHLTGCGTTTEVSKPEAKAKLETTSEGPGRSSERRVKVLVTPGQQEKKR